VKNVARTFVAVAPTFVALQIATRTGNIFTLRGEDEDVRQAILAFKLTAPVVTFVDIDGCETVLVFSAIEWVRALTAGMIEKIEENMRAQSARQRFTSHQGGAN
jgi:hypothetical protein